MTRRALVAALVAATTVGSALVGVADQPGPAAAVPSGSLVMMWIPPGAVSDAMNDALVAEGYDDATQPIPRDVAVRACRTDNDCLVATTWFYGDRPVEA